MDRLAKLVEITLPEYRDRHIFTIRLRLAIFIGFWVLYLYFLRDVLSQTKVITAVISVCFLLTAAAYYNVVNNRLLAVSFIAELLADLVAITAVIYLTGGPYSTYFTIYIFYCFAAGVFYNHYLAGLVGLFCAIFYSIFQLLCWMGIIPPLILNYGDRLPIPAYTPVAHLFFAIAFLSLAIYAVKIASFFSQKRERMLEARNKELMALHKMSSTIRSAISLREVIDQVIASVLEGLEFEAVILLLFDKEEKKIRIYSPKRHPMLSKIDDILGGPLEKIEMPLSLLETPIFQSVVRHQIVFRRNLMEATEGLEEIISPEQAGKIQDILNIKRVIAIPIVAEQEVLGSLVGFSQKPFVDEKLVQTLESFANQAALSIEASVLIEKLQKINEQLKEANRVKSEFLAIMSHELRTPLTAIIGFSELMMEGVMGELSDEQKETVQEVLNNGADLLDLINSLLDLSKIESGKMRFEIRRFDVSEMIERVSRMISSLIHRKGHRFKVHMPEKLPPLAADERKIQQVILNLLSNAIKFTPDGGKIDVDIRYYSSAAEMKKAPWFARIGNKSVNFTKDAFEIVVSDTGVGIRPEHLEMVFDVFQQVDSSITRSFGGTGLGLALAKQYVEQHKGVIWAESEYGKGTSFYVVLPGNLEAGK
jgi:signal transduction histidine kinase